MKKAANMKEYKVGIMTKYVLVKMSNRNATIVYSSGYLWRIAKRKDICARY